MKLNARNKAAFGLGAVGKDMVYILVANYLLYYYNTVLGMNSAIIGTIMMAARVFDAFNDPFMGIVVAKTKTRWGKFRPWIFSGSVLNALVLYALFGVPESVTDGSLTVWLTVCYFAWGITYTLMDIPFWSMIPAITEPGADREGLSSLARACSGIGDAIPFAATPVVVLILGSTARQGYKWWAIIIAVFFVISETIFVLNVPERKEYEKMETTSVTDMFRALFRNDQAMTMVASVILVYTAINIVGNLILYFFTYDVGSANYYSVFAVVCFGTQVIIMMLFPVLRKFASNHQLFIAGFLIQIVGFLMILAMAFTNLHQTIGWWILCIPGMLVYVGYGTLNVLLTIFLADTVDYGEYRYGTRDESVIFSMQTFTVKLASGLAVFIAGLVIDWVGLDPAAAAQTAATLMGLRLWMVVPPIILLVIGIIVYRKFYKLDDATLAGIMKELQTRREVK